MAKRAMKAARAVAPAAAKKAVKAAKVMTPPYTCWKCLMMRKLKAEAERRKELEETIAKYEALIKQLLDKLEKTIARVDDGLRSK